MKRTLVIGDIHGCFAELMDLLDAAALTAGDSIIALGDLADRGPDSVAVVRFFQNHSNACSLMGNHEHKHILGFQGVVELSTSQILVREQFTEENYPEFIRFISTFPFYIELPEAILIHGCLEPGIRLSQQSESVLIGSMCGEAYLRRKYGRPWYELITESKPVIAGHHDYSKAGKPTIYHDKVYLIDTGCCYGHQLTGLLLPDFQIIQVKSRKNYWGLAMQHRA
jgi:serine/threonine protein phosphatase 1